LITVNEKLVFHKVLVGKVKILSNSYMLSTQAGKQPDIFDVEVCQPHT